ncbi:MAG TPA: P-II family nitrogen regulator [Polyangia bacterium]|nr:P-II family nitrogen regulator [Polyangia bacterium]
MKKIEAIVKTFKLEDVVKRLRLVGVTGMTLAEVHGVSASTATLGVFHGNRYTTVSAPRYHLMIVVPDDAVEAVVRAIRIAGCTESPGDGIIIVADVDEVIRVRTGETGAAAL